MEQLVELLRFLMALTIKSLPVLLTTLTGFWTGWGVLLAQSLDPYRHIECNIFDNTRNPSFRVIQQQTTMAKCCSAVPRSCVTRPTPQNRGMPGKVYNYRQKQQATVPKAPKPVKKEQAVVLSQKQLGECHLSEKAFKAFVSGPLNMLIVKWALEHSQPTYEVRSHRT